jgi:uncharacterized protein YaiI (UPF0178 family)
LAEAILSIVLVTYDVTIAIAFPITALVLKKGILNFCLEYKGKDSTTENIKEILETKSLKPEMKEKKKKKSKKNK